MELSTGIEGIRGTINRRFYALILQSQCRPGIIVIRRCDRTIEDAPAPLVDQQTERQKRHLIHRLPQQQANVLVLARSLRRIQQRSEEHTSALQSLMRISYAVFCLHKKKKQIK